MTKIGVSKKELKESTDSMQSNDDDSYAVKEEKTGAQNLVAMQPDKQFTT